MYDIRQYNSTIALTLGENGVGATFPGGITVYDTTLNAILGEGATHFGISICHTVFNILCTALLLPMGGLLEKLANLLTLKEYADRINKEIAARKEAVKRTNDMRIKAELKDIPQRLFYRVLEAI